MKFEELLPVGSVVLLKDAHKKIVIIGVFPGKHMENGEKVIYDYLGVPYPEGYMDPETGLLFQSENIQEVVFTGYSDSERESFVLLMKQFLEKIETFGVEQSSPIK